MNSIKKVLKLSGTGFTNGQYYESMNFALKTPCIVWGVTVSLFGANIRPYVLKEMILSIWRSMSDQVLHGPFSDGDPVSGNRSWRSSSGTGANT